MMGGGGLPVEEVFLKQDKLLSFYLNCFLENPLANLFFFIPLIDWDSCYSLGKFRMKF